MALPVFCHYMVGGITASEAALDVSQAQAVGFDAFALNIISMDSWSTDAIATLFQAAALIGFSLFFSFDMINLSDPSEFIWLIQQYASNPAYYHHDGQPFVSTFYGGTLNFGQASVQDGWQYDFKDVLSAQGIDVYFVPSFSDSNIAPTEIFSTFPVADGIFSWDTAWPWASEGKVNVNSTLDLEYHLTAASLGQTYMMPISTFQFKHLDQYGNYYRRGELNIADRISQVLSVRPTFVEFLTWNDGGESTYIGNVWPEAISGSAISTYTDGFNHSGWQNIIAPFIAARKSFSTDPTDVVPLNGAEATGAFWYRTILTTASITGDPLGLPSGSENAEDVVNVAVLLSASAVGAVVNVYSGGALIGSQTGTQGLNSWEFSGLQVGSVAVDVISTSGATLLSATGPQAVAAEAAIANYNYQVVGL